MAIPKYITSLKPPYTETDHGRIAFWNGKTREDCPYPDVSDDECYWNQKKFWLSGFNFEEKLSQPSIACKRRGLA